jgi:hypothetical protein
MHAGTRTSKAWNTTVRGSTTAQVCDTAHPCATLSQFALRGASEAP